MKKGLSLLLAISLIFTAIVFLPTVTSAADSTGSCGNNLNWSFNSSSGTLTISGKGEMYDYSVGTYSGITMTSAPWNAFAGILTKVIIESGATTIGENAFYRCRYITSVSIPDTVSQIKKAAFFYCNGLASVSIPDSVTTIESEAFSNCMALEDVSLGCGISYLGYRAFFSCFKLRYTYYDNGLYLGSPSNPYICFAKTDSTSVTSVSVSPSTKVIHSSAFSNCVSLTDVTIPASVVCIGNSVFDNCSSLSTIHYSGDMATWNALFSNVETTASIDCVSNESGTCGDSLSWVYDNTTSSLTISGDGDMPDYGIQSLNNHTVSTAPWYHLFNKIETVIIEDSVTSIGKNAFVGADSLKKVYIKRFDTYIPQDSFKIGKGITIYTYKNSIADNYAFLHRNTVVYLECTSHNLSEPLIIVNASCIESGIKSSFCICCGETFETAFFSDSHNFINGVCSLCGLAKAAPEITYFELESKPCYVGGYFDAVLSIHNNNGISAFDIVPVFDKDRFTLESVSTADGIDGSVYSSKSISFFANAEIEKDCDIIVLHFRVDNNADLGKSDIRFAVKSNSVCNRDELLIPCACVASSLTVFEHIKGDINGDGFVNAKDLNRILRYISGDDIYTVTSALDTNGDGSCDVRDIIRLLKHLSGDTIQLY